MTRKKFALKKGYHVLTVRFLDDEWEHFQAVQANLEKKERRRVPYTEIIVDQILGMKSRG